MHPYLIRLGIPIAVQDFFEPYWRTDTNGALLFDYGEEQEHYGLSFHRLPVSEACWTAGELSSGTSQVFICDSAMEAICFLALNAYRLPAFDRLLFIAMGGSLSAEKLVSIRNLAHTTVSVIQENSLLGHITALKVAARLRQQPLQIYTLPDNRMGILFRSRRYDLEEPRFSLSSFEKACGFRFRVRCERPKDHLTFLEQLKEGPFIPNL